MYAAGLTMSEEHYGNFAIGSSPLWPKKLPMICDPLVNIDTYLDFNQITPKFFRLLKQFQPFGPGNLSPVFVTENVMTMETDVLWGRTLDI